jgi:nitrite reductase/ring-hydroxylating ferredoxin subunit
MMEDWKPGHYLEVSGKGFVNWGAGDYFMWKNFCPHAAANIGIEDRYTLQITGELIA